MLYISSTVCPHPHYISHLLLTKSLSLHPTTLNFGCSVAYVIRGFVFILNINLTLIPLLVFFLVTLQHKVLISILIYPLLKHIFLVMSNFLKTLSLDHSPIPSSSSHPRDHFQSASSSPNSTHFKWLTQYASTKFWDLFCFNHNSTHPSKYPSHDH